MAIRSGVSLLLPVCAAQTPPNILTPLPSSVEFSLCSSGEVTVAAKRGVLVQAWINGIGPFDVVVDTGSGSLISFRLAKRLGLKIEGSGTVIGFGGSAQVQSAAVERVQIGGLTLHHLVFAVFDPPAPSGQDFVVIGDQLLLHTVLRIDFDRQEITFFDQNHFQYFGNGISVPIHMQNNGVLADGSEDGIPGLFGIDTGDMHSLTLLAPLVAQRDLVRHYNAAVRGIC